MSATELTDKERFDIIISPSQIESFDHASPFGCERKWWLKKVLKWEEPQSESQSLGDALHATIEHYLGKRPEHPGNPRANELFEAGKHIVDDIKPEVLAVEEWMRLELDGCLVRGRIDALLGRYGVHTILDWKTTSSIDKYAKSPQALKTNTQMMLYAEWVRRNKECGNPLTLSHVYFQTKGKLRAERISTQVTHEMLDTHMNNVIVPLTRRMREVAKLTDVADTRADTDKCRFCAFNNRCPRETIMPSIKELLASYKNPTATQAPTHEPVLPPDAPKSDPALAADPVHGWESKPTIAQRVLSEAQEKARLMSTRELVEAMVNATPTPAATVEKIPAKRGPGRPRKLKYEDAVTEPAKAEPGIVSVKSAASPPVPDLAPGKVFKAHVPTFKVTKATLSHGLTLNMGNFNSARVDVSLEAEVGETDFQLVLDALSRDIKARLEREIDMYQQAAKLEVKR